MSLRRKSMMALASTTVALGIAVIPVLADELLGVLTKVDVEGKKITINEKGTDREIVIRITDETEQATKGGTLKVDLEKLQKLIKKAQDAGKKGVTVKITHEKNVASKLEIEHPKPPKKDKTS